MTREARYPLLKGEFRVFSGNEPNRRSAVETAAAEEIQKSETFGGFLDGFPQLLGKAAAKTATAFPQLPQRRRR